MAAAEGKYRALDANEVARRLQAYDELNDFVENFVSGYCCRHDDYQGGYIDAERDVIRDVREILNRNKEHE